MNSKLKSIVSPMTNPTGYMAAAGAVYAVVVMVYNVANHHAALNGPNLTALIVAAVGAVGALLTRQVVTPVKAPKDGAGRDLVAISELEQPAMAYVPPASTPLADNPHAPPAATPPSA